MNKYIHLFAFLLLASPLNLPSQTIKDYIRNDWPNERYDINGDGTVTDTATGLMWMQCSLGQDPDDNCSGSASEYNWQEALEAAEVSTFATYTDWRLPNIKELSSLAARDRYDPVINSTAFPNTPSDWYWSASPHAGDINKAWRVIFQNGYVNANKRYRNYHVRLVRSGR